MTGDKFVVKVTIERVVREPVAPASTDRRHQLPSAVATTDRKVDTVASVVVTAESLHTAIQKAHAHLVAEDDALPYDAGGFIPSGSPAVPPA